MANFNISYKFVAIDKFSRAAKAIGRSMSGIGRQALALGKQLMSLQAFVGGVVGIGAIAAGMWKTASAASDLADAMQDVKRVSDATDANLDGLKRKFIDMSKATGVSAVNLAKIAFEGGKIGVATSEMEGFVNMVMKTGGAFDMAQDEAGRAIGQIKTKLSLSFKETEVLMQRLNFLADNTAATGSTMIEIVERTSGSLKTLHLPPSVIAGWAAFANQIEVTPQLAASGLNQMTMRMMKMPGMMEKMLKDPENSMKDFLGQIAAIPELERSAIVFKVFGDEAGRFVLKATTNMDLLKQSMDSAMSAKALGSLDREWANILGRASQKALMLKQSATAAAIALGDKLLVVFLKIQPMLMRLVDDFGKLTDNISPEDIDRMSASLVKVGESLSTIAKNMETIAKVGKIAKFLTPTGLVSEAKGGIDTLIEKGTSKIEIFLKGNTDSVQSVKSKGSVATSLNVGQSMVAAQ